MKLNLGTVVSLKSNDLLLSAQYDFLSLGGNENYTTPLMVIVEILYCTEQEIHEETGEEKESEKGRDKYKCLYFSNKSMKIEENWFDENELALYNTKSSEIHVTLKIGALKWGEVVRFKTVDAEAGKKKSFNETDKKKGTKPLLSFTSPSLQVVGFAQADKKEPIIDAYTGRTKRKKSTQLVKCKFFNAELDKFSEQLFPIECLQKIDISKLEARLTQISTIIETKRLILIEVDNNKYFGRPNSVHVISGRYQLVFWNELTKKDQLFWLDQIKDFEVIDITKDSEYFPGIQTIDGEKGLKDVIDYINHKLDDLGKIKIVYRNLKEEVISRYISVNEVEISNKENVSGEIPYYINAHCFLRESERIFRSDRILSIRTIKNQPLIDYLSLILKSEDNKGN